MAKDLETEPVVQQVILALSSSILNKVYVRIRIVM